MEAIAHLLNAVNGFVWGPVTLILLAFAGIYLTIGLRFIQFRKLKHAFSELLRGREKDEDSGDITPFNSLMTALSGTVGTGNIAGVATAVFFGGPGALVYMWLIGLIGMATKFSECMLGAEYREKTPEGHYAGGPMYYMKNGIGGPIGKTLGGFFAVVLLIAGFGIGNGVQANSIASTMEGTLGIPAFVTGIILAAVVGLVIIGGIKRIGDVAGKVVPFMIVLYVATGLFVILVNITELDNALKIIFSSAFSGHAAAGGFAGATMKMAIQLGFSRGVFSNESGLGSAAIAHAAAQTKSPVRQGHIAMLGTFIDTIIVCTITGIAIVITGAYTSGETGAALTSAAFATTYGGLGSHIVNITLLFFVFTTILAWYFYCERALNYFGASKMMITAYRMIWLIVVVIGATAELNFVWTFADTANAFMFYPNIIALIWLSPRIFNKTREYWNE